MKEENVIVLRISAELAKSIIKQLEKMSGRLTDGDKSCISFLKTELNNGLVSLERGFEQIEWNSVHKRPARPSGCTVVPSAKVERSPVVETLPGPVGEYSIYQTKLVEKKCECGSDKCNLSTHSMWCPKHVA